VNSTYLTPSDASPTPPEPPEALGELANIGIASLARYLWPRLKKGLEYLRSPGEEVPSTTSKMERAIREYRRRTKPIDGFKTDQGAENFNRLWMVKDECKEAWPRLAVGGYKLRKGKR